MGAAKSSSVSWVLILKRDPHAPRETHVIYFLDTILGGEPEHVAAERRIVASGSENFKLGLLFTQEGRIAMTRIDPGILR